MTRKLSLLITGLLVTLTLGACDPRVEVAIDREVLEAMKELQRVQIARPFPPSGRRPCTVTLTIYEADQGHLVIDQRIRMHGPINSEGDYRLRRLPSGGGVPPHPWKDADHDALATTATGEDFLSLIGVVTGPHTDDPHLYDVTIEDFSDRGCPSQVLFETEFDVDQDGNDHGGHARGRD